MFASKTPLIFILQILAVIFLSTMVLLITENPLAIIGLMFLPQIPLINGQDQEPEREPAIGFTADID
jgi:hypothetical protein